MIPFSRMLEYGNIVIPEEMKKISASNNSIALLYGNGNLYMRGTNSLLSWGITANNNLLDWTLVLQNVDDIWCGGSHSIALKNDGLYYCAGYVRSLGLTGQNRLWEPYTLLNNLVSTVASTGSYVSKIECGVQGTQVLFSNGDLYCIGYNVNSCLGPSALGTTLTSFVKSNTNIRDMSYNINATMVITNSGTVQVVGVSDNYKLATPASGTVLSVWTNKALPSPYTYAMSVYEGYRTTYIYAGTDNTMSSTSIVGAGYNGYNQIGQPGSFTNALTTYTAGSITTKVRSFGTGWWSVGYSTICSVLTDGELYSAGLNGFAMGSAVVKSSGFTPILYSTGASVSVTEFCIAGSSATSGITMIRSGNNLYAVGTADWLGSDTYTFVNVGAPE